MPVQSQNAKAGIFQYLLKIEGTDQEVRAAQAQLSKLTPETAAVYQALNILPEGELKGWLMANPVQFWKKVITLITGRKFTTGDYVLGERLNDQIYCQPDIGRRQVSDDMVKIAHSIFNQLFGVRIATAEDLDALDHGVTAYRSRTASQGISDDAIERAVYLKQHYYPIATYNRACWDLRYFEIYPLVDRIPDYALGKWYTGPVLGGANAVEGLIPISASSILKQYPGSDFDPATGTTTTPDGQVITPGSNPGGSWLDKIISYAKDQPGIAALAIASLGYVIYEVDENV
jgi:hypothetical protein